MIKDFDGFDLPPSLKNRLREIGFAAPTEIQSHAIPLVLGNKDILASSKTGSGKTGAFAIPMIAKVVRDNISALILVPTRELAIQIKDAVHNIRGNEKINTALIFGDSDMRRQIDTLKKNPNVIIATPGRLNDHIKRKTINLAQFNMLILDEFDRMLEMGFKEEIKTIVSRLPKDRQTLMFSATTRKSIKDLAREYLKDHEEIVLANTQDDHKNIQQEFIQVSHNNKYDTLIQHINSKDGTVIVFVATKRMADDLSQALQNDGHSANSIHGDLRQRERERVMKAFRDTKYRILVATDIAARGLDVPHVKVIVNYDMPKNPEDYTHRIGRTGRADAIGLSLSFITPADRRIHQAIIMKSNSDEFESDFTRKPRPRGRGERSFGGGDRYSGNRRGERSFGGGGDSRYSGGNRDRGERSSGGNEDNRYSGNRGDDNRHSGNRRGERSFGGGGDNQYSKKRRRY